MHDADKSVGAPSECAKVLATKAGSSRIFASTVWKIRRRLDIYFMKNTKKLFLSALVVFAAAVFLMPQVAVAQDEEAKPFDAESVAANGKSAADFAPEGWVVEEEVKGDVTGDGVGDIVIKLIEDKAKKEDEMVDRNRVLVIVQGDGKGSFTKLSVADKILQCTACGGAFYGVVDAPANVTIEKGVIIINQDHGSRWVTDTTLRFRFDQQPNMFILIGYDYASRDRAAGDVSTESTNYLTGKRITEIGKGKRTTKKTTTVEKMRYSIEEIDYQQMESESTTRLGLD